MLDDRPYSSYEPSPDPREGIEELAELLREIADDLEDGVCAGLDDVIYRLEAVYGDFVELRWRR